MIHAKNILALLLLCSLLWAGCSGANPQPAGAPGSSEAADASIAGPTWRLVAFGEAAGEAPPASGDAEITATFDAEEGRVAGSAGCNRYFGGYEMSGGGRLAFSQVGATRRACAPPTMAREQAYLDALDATRGWERAQDRLTLLDANDEPLLRFTARASGAESTQATLDGTVTYRPRIALSPEAVVRVRLVQAGRADDPARILAEQAIPTDGRQVPIPFSLSYAPAQVEAGRRYLIEAEIHGPGGAVQWMTEAPRPVLTQGAPSGSVEVVVVQAGGNASGGNASETSAASRALVGPTWRLVQIETPGGGTAASEEGAAYTIAFEAGGRFGGQADCNRFSGSYETGADGRLTLSNVGATLAACPPPSQSTRFTQALADVQGYSLRGDRLRLRLGPGGALTFERASDGAQSAAPMEPQRAGETFVFDCEAPGGESFSFTTRTGPGERAVWLPARFASADARGEERYLVLGQVRAASGAKYEGNGVTVWTKGGNALLTVGGETFTGCTLAGPQASVWEDARLSGWDVRALGQEPGWELLIREGNRIRFAYDYGEREVVAPASAPTVEGATRTHRAETEAHRLTVTLADESCTDAMSGKRFPLAVTVELDGETYRGCGRTLDR